MSLFMKKHAIEMKSSLNSKRKRSRRPKTDYNPSANRICRVEELEKREYLAADPISVGVVYAEQYNESLGDKFFVAWVGGEDGCTTLDSLVIDLDKNQNGKLDEGEACFDTAGNGEVYSYVPFTLVEKTDDIGYSYEVEDGGTTLKISFTNFHAGDKFIFCIDLDEYQPSSTNNAQVEGAEMGGSLVDNLDGSLVTATFSSTHYQTKVWTGMFVDNYDLEYDRTQELDSSYDRADLPYDLDDNNEGIAQAGVYERLDLTPKPIVISGHVYADHDVDCNYEPQEEDAPLANVQVTLYDEFGASWTTTTDINGYYEFADEDILPGTYKIFSQSNVVSPEGWQYADFCAKGGEFGTKISPLEIDVTGMQGGDVAPNNDFAKVLPGSISGYVFEDFNNNGNKDLGESWNGIEYPAKVELYRITTDSEGNKTYTLMETQTVDKDGYYKFELDCSYNEAGTLRKLPGRTYEVREVFSSDDYVDGKDHVGSLGGIKTNDVISEVFVGYDQHGVHYDFGELKLGSIAGNVYEDRNDNGVMDKGEAGIAGVTVELYQWDGERYVKIDETKTEKDGSYLFENLDIIHDYAVKELQPNDYSDGKDSVGTLGGILSNDYISNVEIGWDQHGYHYDFGELKLGSIAGNVYEDRNDNGVFDESEIGIGAVTVELYQWNGTDYEKIRETKTNDDGSYRFDNLDINKQYAVREKQPESYADGKDSVGSLGGVLANDEIRSIDVQWDEHGVEYNFGELKLGSISGYVYHDANNNGQFEPNEDPIANVVVELYRLNGDEYEYVGKTTTNNKGFYKFDNLDIERTYAVKEIQPENWNDGKDTVGTLGGNIEENDFIDSVRVLWDQHGENYNFGELLPVGSLSGHVYEDNNDNGVREAGEAGIANVVVQLYTVGKDGIATLVATQTTDEEGFYKFDNLSPRQTYLIRETQPTAYYDGKEAIGTIFGEKVGVQTVNDEISDIYLPNNGIGVDYDFGELKPGSVSGFVYVDANDNGIKESWEAPIPNTTVTLWILNEETGVYEATGRTYQTDANGYYVFDNLQPSRFYRIVETQPSGYNDGKDTIGSLGGIVENDVFSAIPVKPGDNGIEYNFGELKPQNDKPEKPDPGPHSYTVHVPSNTWGAAPTNFPYVYYQPYNPGSMTTLYGGGGFVEPYAWHLSTIDDAYPKNDSVITWNGGYRRDLYKEQSIAGNTFKNNAQNNANGTMLNVSMANGGVDQGLWILRELGTYGDDEEPTYRWGVRGGIAISGDWNGDGKDYVGIFANGDWLLDRDGDGDWDSDDIMARMGKASDQPVTGDWDGDGKTDIGVFGPRWANDQYLISVEQGLPADLKNYVTVSYKRDGKDAENSATKESALARLRHDELRNLSRVVVRDGMDQDRYDLIDHVFSYGAEGDVAITGDWTGEGLSKPGLFHNGDVYLDRNGSGVVDEGDEIIHTGFTSDFIPVVGDWNGDGVDTVGFFRDGDWQIDADGDGRLERYHLGQAGDQPVVGDWDGDGMDEFGVYRSVDSTSDDLDTPQNTNAQSTSSDYSSEVAMR